MRALLRCRPALLLWSANLLASLAGWSLGIAVSVHVYELTGSPVATTGLLVAGCAPGIVVGSLGGLVADRASPSRLVKQVAWARVVVVVLLWVGAGSRFGLVASFGAVCLQATAMQLFLPAERAALAEAVSQEQLRAAMAANSVAANVTRLVGPALGALLVGTAGFAPAAAVIAALLAASAALLSGLRAPQDRPMAASRPSPLRHWSEGLRDLHARPMLRAIAALMVLDACKEGAYSGLFPALMLGVVGASPAFMGLANSSFAVTAVMAAPASPHISARWGHRPAIACGTSLAGALLLVLAVVPTPLVAILTIACAGFPFTVSWVAGGTLLLEESPQSGRGRAVGNVATLAAAAQLASATASGLAAQRLGTPTVVGVAAVVQIAAGPLFLVLSRPRPEGPDAARSDDAGPSGR